MKDKLPLSTMLPAAELVKHSLSPHCTFCEIAGSIRRKAQFVGDIEIVCLPVMVEIEPDLFGGSGERKRDRGFVNAIKSIGEIVSGVPETGRMVKVIMRHGSHDIQVDIFIPQEHDLYRQFAIRTGSADFAFKRIAVAWTAKGWVGTPDGLRLKSECTGKVDESSGKTAWTCHSQSPTLPPEWKSEEQFFEWLGLSYIEPEKRYV